MENSGCILVGDLQLIVNLCDVVLLLTIIHNLGIILLFELRLYPTIAVLNDCVNRGDRVSAAGLIHVTIYVR